MALGNIRERRLRGRDLKSDWGVCVGGVRSNANPSNASPNYQTLATKIVHQTVSLKCSK